MQAAVARLGIEHPVVVDSELQVWDMYGNEGWPARYLWNLRGGLFSVHYGEGAYAETEREIGELLGIEVDPVAPVRPEDEPGVILPAQTEDQRGAYQGPYEAGAVHLVATAAGRCASTAPVRGRPLRRAHRRRALPPHAGRAGDRGGEGVEVLATCFTPAPAA